MTATLTSASRPGITFAVDDVTPAETPLKECRAHEAVKRMVRSDIESCSDYHGSVVVDVDYQPLLAAVYTAFSQHRPLALTPDAVWLTISQGVAHHMAIHGERLRSRFVAHQGRLELRFTCSDWVAGSPENPWPEAFTSWASQIREHVGPEMHDLLVCDFSTSGPVEQAAGQIVMMDIFERYFQYVVYCVCGIPTVTLEGTTGDWERLREKVLGLRIFDMDWWLEHLLPICDQFVRASRGDIDLSHWQSICKIRSEYGGDIINGWVAQLFPYLREYINGPCKRRNPIFENGKGFQTLVAPPGLSRVPFIWRDAVTGRERAMEAIAGLVGMTQETFALRPRVGWAVREVGQIQILLRSLESDHTTFPGVVADRESLLPPDLAEFYIRTNGAEIFPSAGGCACRIVPADKIDPLGFDESPEKYDQGYRHGPKRRTWHRFAYMADRSWLAINLDPSRHYGVAREPALAKQAAALKDEFSPICVGRPGGFLRFVRPERNLIVALSFGEFLERLLDAKGEAYWLESGFSDYGDAKQIARRD